MINFLSINPQGNKAVIFKREISKKAYIYTIPNKIPVARMKRSEIRVFSGSFIPGFVTLHPGYVRLRIVYLVGKKLAENSVWLIQHWNTTPELKIS